MKLTSKLLGYLNRPFNKDPEPFVALRVTYAGGLTWTVTDGVLAFTVTGGPGVSATYDLSQYTIGSLVTAIAGQAGFEVVEIATDRAKLSALVLLDGAGDQSRANGDALLGYTSLLWAILESWAHELQGLRDQIAQMVLQMTTKTGQGAWLDYLGSFYKVPRLPGEMDPQYGPRIIAEALRAKSNNVALEMAIEDYTGQPCTVVDVTIYLGVFPVYDGTISYDGSYDYATVGLPNYGLFDVTVAYDLIGGGDIRTFLATVQAIVERLRAGGTHLRALALSSAASPLEDAFPAAPTDSSSAWATVLGALSDTLTAPTESLATLPIVLGALADALTAPSEAATGQVYAALLTESGVPITDHAGDPILAAVSSLFI